MAETQEVKTPEKESEHWKIRPTETPAEHIARLRKTALDYDLTLQSMRREIDQFETAYKTLKKNADEVWAAMKKAEGEDGRQVVEAAHLDARNETACADFIDQKRRGPS